MRIVRLIAWMTQFGFSAVAPLLLCVFAAQLLRNTWNLGGWVMAAGVVLGVLGMISGIRTSMKAMMREAEQDEKEEPPVSFNDHR